MNKIKSLNSYNVGKNNPNYNGGKPYCLDCYKEISYTAIRCISCLGKLKEIIQIGSNNPNYRHGETLVEHNCIDCGKVISYPTYFYGEGRCRSCSKKGKLNINYYHGKCYFPYSQEFNKSLKLKIRKRDNFICQRCGINEKNCTRNLDIHHIDYNKINCKENNLISLCQICHCKTNTNRDYWFAYYTYIMETIYGNV